MVTRYPVHALLQLSMLVITMGFSVSAKSSELNVSISHDQVELGKPVILDLHSSQTSISLEKVDLTQLKNDFHIKNSSEIITVNQQQEMSITLYPRTTGQLFIPELHFLNTSSRPIPLKVLPAIDPKNNTPINVKYSVSTYTPWKKQQTLIRLELTGHSSILVLRTPSAYSELSEIISLDTLSHPINNGNNKLTRHTAGWAVFPLYDGPQQLDLPAIELVRDGVTTHRFYSPYVQLDVKHLPVYIPATMPIGKLSFKTSSPSVSILLTDTIQNTEISLKSSGVLPSTLPTISTQLKSNDVLSFYPAQKKSTQSTSSGGIVTENSYLVNFKAHQQGWIKFSEIKLNYFDPDTGTIKSIKQEMGNSFSIHRGVVIFLLVIITYAGSMMLVRLYHWSRFKWHCFTGYRQVLQSLPSMSAPEDLRHGLQQIAKAEHWHGNLTLQQWARYWSETSTRPCPVNIDNLGVMLYGGKNSDIEQLKYGIRQACFIRWPIFRLFY